VALSLALQTSSQPKQVTSQSWAPLDAHYGWASFVADRQSTDAGQRTSVDGRSSHDCVHATGHAIHWRRWLKMEPGVCQRFWALPNRPGWSGAPPNRPVWRGPAVEDSKPEQSRVMDTRSFTRLEYVRRVYFWTVTPYIWIASLPSMPI